MVNCSAVNCSNRSEKNIRLFGFPSDKTRRKIWINNCKRDRWEPTENARLCEVSKYFYKLQTTCNQDCAKVPRFIQKNSLFIDRF